MNRNPARLLVLADDLTGALDTGIQFAKNNIATGVLLSAEAELDGESPEVLVINTNTRHCSPAEARSVTAACAVREAVYIYKKTDSTLRGHIGAELDALMDARNVRWLPFVPAYPALGRTTKEGRQYLRGKPVDETEMASDPLNPVRTSYIPGIIGEESAIPVRLIRRGEEITDETDEKAILVFDGETEEDLNTIAAKLFQKNLLAESAGCAGFAEALKNVLPFERGAAGSNKPALHGPILIISGSLHPVSLEQVKTAMDSGIPGFAVAEEKLLDSRWFDSEEAKSLSAACFRTIKDRRVCILGTEMSLGRRSSSNRVPASEPPVNVSGRLGKLVKLIAKEICPLVLAIFGGDTLFGIMKSEKYSYIKPLREIKPGIVMARAEGSEGSTIIITKSGAFGERGIIQVILDYCNGGGGSQGDG